MLPVNWPALHWPALNLTVIGRATLGGLGLLVPAQVLAWLLVGEGADPAWSLLYLAIGATSFTVAGAIAGWSRTDTPILYGVLAACAVYLIATVVAGVRLVVTGHPIIWIGMPAMILLACTCGALGGLAAEWAYRRRRRAGRLVNLGEPAG